MTKMLRVLIVEDSEDDALLMIRTLKKGGYDPVYQRVETAGAMRAALREQAWDVILCDYQMPKFTGLTAIAVLKESNIDIPLIIVSGAIGEEIAVDCMRFGAHDYVMKGNLPRLVPAIEREMKEAESRRQRKQVEKALRESELHFKMLFDRAPLGYQSLDVNGNFIDVNQTWLDTLGYAREEVIGGWFGDFLAPGYKEAFKERFPMFKAQGEINIEFEMLHKNGHCLFIAFDGRIGKDLHGNFQRTHCILKDITEQKQAENELVQMAREWQMTFDATNDAIWVLDRDNRVLRSNRTAERYFLRPSAEQIGRHCWEIVHGTAQPIPECPILRVRESLKRETTELREGERWFEVIVDPILDPAGRYAGAVHIISDITERKQVERQLQDSLERLRKSVGATIQVMVSAVETRDPYTSGHQTRSADLARAIAAEMGLPQEKIDGVNMAGAIHDIGKLSIPAEILSKPTKLSDIEFSLIKEHARQGYEILKEVESPWPLADIVHQHHERMDGSGYPRQMKGDDILIEARILAVADVVESMASHRPYRAALGIEAALEEIGRNRGIFYDEAVAAACLRVFREKGYKLENATDADHR